MLSQVCTDPSSCPIIFVFVFDTSFDVFSVIIIFFTDVAYPSRTSGRKIISRPENVRTWLLPQGQGESKRGKNDSERMKPKSLSI